MLLMRLPPQICADSGAGWRRAVFGLSAHRKIALTITLLATVLGRLIRQTAMVQTVGPAGHRRTAIPEVRTARVAERPATHGLFQFDDSDPERHRHDDALVGLGLGLRLHQWGDRQRCCTAHNSRGAHDRPRGAMDRLRGRRGARTQRGRAWRFGAARETEPMNLADDGVSGQSMTEQDCDLARALALEPVLPKLIHPLIRPGHCGVVGHFHHPDAALRSESLLEPDEAQVAGQDADQTLSEGATTRYRGDPRKKYTTR